MVDTLRQLLLSALRVPARPQPPPGDAASLLTFRAAHRYFQYRVALWALKQLAALTALIAGAVFFYFLSRTSPEFTRFTRWGLIELFAWAVFIVQLPFSFMLMRLDFEMRWYILADRSLRIREGMIVVREKTMSYANIQNIEIRRNPLQRIFGLATVAVRAAGGGSGTSEHKGSAFGSHTHESLFEGVDNADEIRRILRERIRRHRDSGLGDPDDVQDDTVDRDTGQLVTARQNVDPQPATSPALLAARNLLHEARALRNAMSS